jgi:hypothetical protein
VDANAAPAEPIVRRKRASKTTDLTLGLADINTDQAALLNQAMETTHDA